MAQRPSRELVKLHVFEYTRSPKHTHTHTHRYIHGYTRPSYLDAPTCRCVYLTARTRARGIIPYNRDNYPAIIFIPQSCEWYQHDIRDRRDTIFLGNSTPRRRESTCFGIGFGRFTRPGRGGLRSLVVVVVARIDPTSYLPTTIPPLFLLLCHPFRLSLCLSFSLRCPDPMWTARRTTARTISVWSTNRIVLVCSVFRFLGSLSQFFFF